MGNQPESGEELVARAFRELGFLCVPIPRAAHKTPDLEASRNGERWLVEVKEKQLSAAFGTMLEQARHEGLASFDRELARTNALDAMFSEAADQLEAKNQLLDDQALRLVAVVARSLESKSMLDLCEHTLYGLAKLTVFDQGGGIVRPSTRCFFYDYAVFWRRRGIDAVLLCLGSAPGVKLCVNPLGRACSRVRASGLYRSLGTTDSVCDPDRLEEQGDAFVIRSELPRQDSKARWRYLFEQYGARTSRLLESQWHGWASFSEDPCS